MDDIRKNIDEEKVIITGKCKMPSLMFGLYICFIVITFTPSIVGLVNLNSESAIFIVIFLLLLVCFILHYKTIKASYITISNKRIYGIYSRFFTKRKFSYRLDMIDNINIEYQFTLRILEVNFNQGYQVNQPIFYKNNAKVSQSPNTFKFYYLADDKIYVELEKLITSLKNEKNLMVDIEMKKIDVESRKAAAFENVANVASQANNKLTQKDYIDQIKELKNLFDQKIITKEEFEKKKSELLNNNE